MPTSDYVHGYSGREHRRLLDQAATLAELLHHDTCYPAGIHVLEAGCGVGAQTSILAESSPNAHFTSVDISLASLQTARTNVFADVKFCAADLYELPFEANTFDHLFVCFVLEHLKQPLDALMRLQRVLKPGGSITVVEGDHASALYYPASSAAQRTIDCLIEIQARAGGNGLIGRQLYPLLKHAGYSNIRVAPRQVYADSSRPEWVEGFTRKTFNAMVEGARETALAMGLVDVDTWERGIADLYATAGDDGTFSYTFFKGVAVK